jgi:uncharacterized NAD-dependent epimerase/dehydratase family protein
MTKERAIILTNGLLDTEFAKTCHGLLRGTDRYEILAVIDYAYAGKDAGEVMQGKPIGIPVFASIADFYDRHEEPPRWCVVGVAFPGGRLPEEFRQEILTAIDRGLSVVCGLHTLLSEDPEFSELARERGVQLLDIRKPRPASELPFWSGEIYLVTTPRIAVLGIDCAVGKRTTCRFLMEACRKAGIYAEMIYTGQTGWMQGYRHGFIFDATLNDFISGEIERVIMECERVSRPELILIEGQSSLQNPSGPCGSEFLLSGNVKGVVLQHIPGRKLYDDTQVPLKSLESEMKLIEYYGAEILAVTLNSEHLKGDKLLKYRDDLEAKLGLPVGLPLEEGVDKLIPAVQAFIEQSNESLTQENIPGEK